MKNLFIVIGLLMLIACNKNEDTVVRDTAFKIEYVDSESNDLLDPNTSNYYKWDKIRLYPDINNLEEPFYSEMLDNEYGYRVIKEIDMEYYQIIITEVSDNEGNPFLIKLYDNDTDTIECQVKKYDGNAVTEKIWYNGELKWDSDSGTPKVLRIIKD